MTRTFNVPTDRTWDHGQNGPAGVEEGSIGDFLSSVLGEFRSIQYLSSPNLYRTNEAFKHSTASLLVQAAHQAFADHVPFSLRPEVVWYTVVHEIAIHVKANPKKYAQLFNGDSDQKKILLIVTNDIDYGYSELWGKTIGEFRSRLEQSIGLELVNLFLPGFSTATPESEVAILVAFMDTVSKFYDYRVSTDCHIPAFRIEGSTEDWAKIASGLATLSTYFTDLKDYLYSLIDVVTEIAEASSGREIDEVFWRSFYKYNSGSGGARVNGWINALFAYYSSSQGFIPKPSYDWKSQVDNPFKGVQPGVFSSHVSTVPFVWNYYGHMYQMVFAAGIMGVEFDGEFLEPRLGFGVFEK